MRSFLVFFLANLAAFGGVGVTSQEQFTRLMENGSPDILNYNFDRAYLEVRAAKHCPPHGKAFFFVHITKEGQVQTIRGHLVALSADLRSIALKWADGILKQLRFKPLMYGAKPASVDMALTMVCSE